MTGVLVLAAVLAASTLFGLVHRTRSGRMRPARSSAPGRPQAAGQDSAAQAAPPPAPSPAEPDESLTGVLTSLGATPGQRATLLQFSSAFCAPCRATRRVLSEVADCVPGVRHVEVDAEQHLDVVRLLKVTSTPTTLVLDGSAQVVARAKGQPRKEAVLAALADAVS